MNCPVCDQVKMREVEKDEVLIDICPNCKGVWLDRGELEKILQGVREIRQPFNQWYDHHDRDDDDRHRRDDHGHSKHKRKKSVIDMLGDMFD